MILLIVSRYVNTVYHQHTLYSTCVCVSVSDTVNRYSRDALSTLALARALGFIGRNSKILLTIRKSTMAPNEDYTSIRLLDRSHDGSEKEHQRSGHPIQLLVVTHNCSSKNRILANDNRIVKIKFLVCTTSSLLYIWSIAVSPIRMLL